jgi:hypothetical protein
MEKTGLLTIAFAVACFQSQAASAQINEKDKFTIRIVKIHHVHDGCTVDAVTAKVHYKLTSDSSGPCSMLSAGEDYKAVRVNLSPMPPDNTSTGDTPALLIFGNVENKRWPEALFDIESEEAR